jgi:lipopolysaccharide transport system ATP-binding protein
MHNNLAIKVNNLTKSYRLYVQPIDRVKESLSFSRKTYHTNFHAVKNLSFEVQKGESVGIIGRNGCGKSTLLKMITNVLTPTSGQVTVDGEISAILELGAGFNPEMTGIDNVYLNASIAGLTKAETDNKFEKINEFAELGEFIYQPLKTYSSGMKARLAFAVAINVDPDILIIDEALSVGDVAFQRKCYAKIEQIRSNGATILFVSHSESSIVSLCNRAIWISNGEKILDGIPKLVTGLYLKYSNEVHIDKSKISIEYREITRKGDVSKHPHTKEAESADQAQVKHLDSKGVSDFYDPELQPLSKIPYAAHGAEISDVNLTTLAGDQVNVITQGKCYIYRYKITFQESINDVLCAMTIKTSNGIIIAGGHYPEVKQYMRITEKEIEVFWQWRCNLLKGVYFFNAGVSNAQGFMHRIVDAYMIRVVNRPEEKIATHLIDLDFNVTHS